MTRYVAFHLGLHCLPCIHLEVTNIHEQSDLGLHCLSKRLQKHFSRGLEQITFVVIGTLRVNPCPAGPGYILFWKLGEGNCLSSTLLSMQFANIRASS